MQKTKYNMQAGMTLVELMIALLIGLLLSAAIITVYISNKNTFWETEEAASMQDNALFAKRLIQDEIWLAEYHGENAANIDTLDYSALPDLTNDCGPANVKELDKLPSVFAIHYQKGMVDLPECLADKHVKDKTDVLFIKRVALDAPAGPLKAKKIYFKPLAQDTGAVYRGTKNFGDMDDAASAYTEGGTGNSALREFIYRVYYIYKPDGVVFPQLRRMSLRINVNSYEWFVESVAEGIADIHYQFGLDTSAVPNRQVNTYVTANILSTGDWSDVHAVKMFMLTQSTRKDMDYEDDKTYSYRGTDNPGVLGGHYHRKLQQTTFMIPNNIPPGT